MSPDAVLYVACCLAGLVGLFHVNMTHWRRRAVWWAWTLVAFAILWEVISAARYGAPGFPSVGWVLMPGLALGWWGQAWVARKKRQ